MTEFNRIFIDTAPIIYFLENDVNYGTIAEHIFLELIASNKQMVTSVITLEEYLVPVYRNESKKLETLFFSFFSDCNMDVIHITEEIAIQAAKIRSKYRHFKAMDALQLSTAYVSGCDLFLTNDKQLLQFQEVKCVSIDGFRISGKGGNA